MSNNTHGPDAPPTFTAGPVEIVEVDTRNVANNPLPVVQEQTRSKIAVLFTKMFLALVGITILLPFVVNLIVPESFIDPLSDAKELVTVLASVLAGPFGFIVGFYFKQAEGNNDNG